MKQVFAVSLVLLFSLNSYAQDRDGKEFSDGHGGTVYLPLGDVSFADKAVARVPGAKYNAKGVHADVGQAIGIPDYTTPSAPGFVSLGCDGSIVLQFVDNVLVDVKGPDLFVFEVGPAVEPTRLAISADGERWTEVGLIEGARADVDIAPHVGPSDVFYYVSLTNAGRGCGGPWPGADVDAVAAMGSAYRLSLSSAVLFDVGKSVLKPDAEGELRAAASKIRRMGTVRLVIEGHTDSTGTSESNQVLSEARAEAVRAALAQPAGGGVQQVQVRGQGETHPVATNETEEGRALNRRVDILVLPVREVTPPRPRPATPEPQAPVETTPSPKPEAQPDANAPPPSRREKIKNFFKDK